ncbi:hypothetical protein [Virgisporangium aurantiacum]|uniref:Uncharacterized protein n=1 Tax=Virgisporangium aurantiacum TaxID=175570 RepID=A0A8J3ZFF3_9ACTN|nr:hypothetical protein [Virgisporangium aurantiacum]GIJ60353.1 hypothetical protein Vau01_078690 [Virgisporangium aurantiacum]
MTAIDVEPRVRAVLETLTDADLFADPFLFADATGARRVSRAAFLASLPRRARMFADAGVGSAELTTATQHRLDEQYLLVHTTWSAPSRTGGDPAVLASSYLLRHTGEAIEVVAYLNHRSLA